jgi:hypothetical protein
MNPGTPMSAMAGQGALDPASLPPDVLSGILQAGEKMSTMLDALAQATPAFAPDWAAAKNALLSALAKVASTGAPPASPFSAGPNFPGGGTDRGGMPLASGGQS